jgi:hypothetical protein
MTIPKVENGFRLIPGEVINAIADAATGGVQSIIAGSNISVDQSTGNVTISATGGGGGGNTTIVTQLTSGASPVDVTLPTDNTWQTLVVEVTSGGTAGTEVVNVPNPALDGHNYNSSMIGRNVIVTLKTRTNGSDVVHVTLAGGNSIISQDISTTIANQALGNFVVLDFVDSDANFLWGGYNFNWNNWSGNNDSIWENTRVPLPAGGTTGQVPIKNSNEDGDVSWGNGISGSFTTVDLKTVTVVNGLITSIV